VGGALGSGFCTGFVTLTMGRVWKGNGKRSVGSGTLLGFVAEEFTGCCRIIQVLLYPLVERVG
jgi:hypothetical protein